MKVKLNNDFIFANLEDEDEDGNARIHSGFEKDGEYEVVATFQHEKWGANNKLVYVIKNSEGDAMSISAENVNEVIRLIKPKSGAMLSEKEINFTISKMINHAIFLIEDCNECEDAVFLLSQLEGLVKGRKEKAIEYWYDTLSSVIHDIPAYLSFCTEEELPFINSIIETLYHSN
jgi:hypothetical protein